MNTQKKAITAEIISALFIFLFLYAAISKLIDFEKFRVELAKSPILNFISDLVAFTIPSFEIFLSALLTIKRFQFIALYASFSLMVMFSAYIVVILKFSPYIPCSCGGILQNMSWVQHLWLNFLFMFLGATGVLIYPNKYKELIGR
jgi:Methylamine utilisation protein MauE